MAKRKNKRSSTGATVAKITALIVLVIILLAAAVYGIFMLTNGFGGTYATFITKINDEYILASGSTEIPRESKIEVISYSDYAFTVTAAEQAEGTDFEVALDGETYSWSDFIGKDFTSAFTFTQSDGVVTLDYGNPEEIISAATGQTAVISGDASGTLFCMTISSGNSSIDLTFQLAQMQVNVDGIIIVPDHIYA